VTVQVQALIDALGTLHEVYQLPINSLWHFCVRKLAVHVASGELIQLTVMLWTLFVRNAKILVSCIFVLIPGHGR
jgi:hypothetical protein